MKKHLFLLAFFGFLLQGCVKTATVPIDHVNKFTCKVNGVFWEAVPFQNFILGNDLQMTKSPFFDIASVYASNVKKNQTITFNLSLSDSVKIFTITDSNPFADYSNKCNIYKLDTLSNRTVNVTEHNKTRKIVKGIFFFRAINFSVGCVDTVTITNGFFDMQYSAQ
jgi:hypothetical protein